MLEIEKKTSIISEPRGTHQAVILLVQFSVMHALYITSISSKINHLIETFL